MSSCALPWTKSALLRFSSSSSGPGSAGAGTNTVARGDCGERGRMDPESNPTAARVRGGDGASGDGDVLGIAGDPSVSFGGAISCVVVEAGRIVFTSPIDANASSDDTDAAPKGNAAASAKRSSAGGG
jgi:hypothetical protein